MNNIPVITLIIIYIVTSLIIVMTMVVLLRWYLRRWLQYPTAFHKNILLITLPKEGQEDDQQRSVSADQVRERIAVAEMFFSTLAGMRAQRGWRAFWHGRDDHFSLEIVADKEGLVSFYAAIPRSMKTYFEQQLHAQYETAQIVEVTDYNIFDPQSVILGSRLRLEKSQIFPIQTYDKMDSDPLNALTNVLSKFEKHEGAAVQYILRSAHPSWHRLSRRVARTMQQGKSLEQAYREEVSNPLSKIFYYAIHELFRSRKNNPEKGIDPRTERQYQLSPMEQEVVKSLEEKTSKSGFDVNIRVVVAAANHEIAESKLQNILNVFSQYASYQYGNKFIASKPSNDETLIRDFIYRHTDHRKHFVLNTKEMSSLWHLPLPSTETPNIRWLLSRKAPPPSNLPKEGLVLGKVKYRGQETMVRMLREDRRRHFYVIGKSGSGKSELLKSMAIQDIQNGEGVGVVDPHGDLVEDILAHVPRERADDVVYFNPSDTERPMGLNMLEYETNEQRDFAVQEMVAIFYKLFGSEMIGPMFEHYMRNAMLALMEDKEAGATLIEIPRMFTDQAFRKKKLEKVHNMIVKNFWQAEYEQSQAGQQAADMLSYVISKIGRFLTNDMMRNIIGQTHSGFNFKDVMNDQKIVLVNLSKGKVGEVNSSLLGLIIVSKIQMAAMSRADMPSEQRKDFFLYMDEFQNFATDSIATILSEARKYRLDLIMAHQYIGQMIKDNNTNIRDAVFGNAGTMVAFRVGVEDAEVLAKEFAPVFDANDVINVEEYTANIKLLINNSASRPFNMSTIMPSKGDSQLAQKLKELSRYKYAHDRQIVESEINERAQWDKVLGGGQTAPDAFM